MWHALILTGFLSSVVADDVSGFHAASVGAHEVVLSNSLLVRQAEFISMTSAEVAATEYLWTHGHRRIAVGVLIGSTLGHGWAAQHNWRLR